MGQFIGRRWAGSRWHVQVKSECFFIRLDKTLETVSPDGHCIGRQVTSQESSPSLMTMICFSAGSLEKENAGFVADLCKKPCEERNTQQWLSALMFFKAFWNTNGNVWVTDEAAPKITPLICGQNRGLSPLYD